MPVAVACPKCKKKYSLPDELLGKPVKCTSCATQFKTPARTAPGPAAAKAATVAAARAAAQQKARELAQKNAAELKKLGVDGLIQRAPDVFAGTTSMQGTPDPLANHMIEDPGFGDRTSALAAIESGVLPDNPLASMFANPALEKPKTRKNPSGSKPRKKKRPKWHAQPWFLLVAIFVPVHVIVLVLLTQTQWIPANIAPTIAWVVIGIFALVNLMVALWGLSVVAAEGDGLQVALCVLVPGYMIYFIIMHWSAMRDFTFASIAGSVISPLSIAVLSVSAAWIP